MYEFKLRIHISGWLILALLLVILLCHFVPAASAAANDMMLYNGIELPNIDQVWTDKETYPYATIYYLAGGRSVYLRLSESPCFYNENVSKFRIEPGLSWYLLSDSPSWVGGSFDTGNYGPHELIWTSYDMYTNSGDLYFEYSPPQPVGGSDPSDPSEPTGAVLPVFTVEPPLITWIEYNVGDAPTPVTVDAVVDDGGTISYTWYRTIYAESGSPSNVVFSTGATLVPDTSVVSYSSYYCVATNTNGEFSQSAYSLAYRVKVVESGAADPPSEMPTYPSAEDIGSSVGDAFQDVLDQNDINTSEQGNSFVDQITQIVPNESQGFVNAMGGLVDSLSYGGTECVLTVPALVMPQIGDLVPQYTLLEKQEVDLESYFNMFPAFIVTLVQSLFTVALIVFCFKELYSTVSYFFVLRGGET